MKRTCTASRGKTVLSVSLLAGLLLTCGCRGGPEMRMLPRVSLGPHPDLDGIRQMVRANCLPIMTLTAKCNAVLSNVDMKPTQHLPMDGRLLMAKPGCVHVDLRRAGTPAVKAIGDGERFETRMPMLGAIHYSGRYGDPLEAKAGRINFVADDVADALDMTGIFDNTVQVLRTYPPLWDVHVQDPSTARQLRSAVYVDSLLRVDTPMPGLKILYSLAVHRRTGKVLALDKFRFDGSLRTRIWILGWRTVTGPDMRKGVPEGTTVTVDVPSDFAIYYPPPLEGTSMLLHLSQIKLNAYVDKQLFVVGRK